MKLYQAAIMGSCSNKDGIAVNYQGIPVAYRTLPTFKCKRACLKDAKEQASIAGADRIELTVADGSVHTEVEYELRVPRSFKGCTLPNHHTPLHLCMWYNLTK